MTTNQDELRKSANVYLDMVTAWDVTSRQMDEGMVLAVGTALERFNDLDLVQATSTDDGDLSLDITSLVGGGMVAMGYLVHNLAAERGVDPLVVVSDAREWLARYFADPPSNRPAA
jgi:hypothetical protein